MLVVLFHVLLSFTPTASADLSEAPLALVYTGTGTCKDGCAQAAADVAVQSGLQVRFVSAKEIKPEIFRGAAVWIQPGGNAIKAAKAIGLERLALIRKFVRYGGGYVGFCAGAFLADDTVDDSDQVQGLGILKVHTWDYPVYSNEGWGTLVWVFWNNAMRQVFFNGGASFYVNHKTKGVEVLATYGAGGLPATIQSTYGKGTVVVTGTHPEATEAWKQGARSKEPNLYDADGDDFDMAQDMILRALKAY